MGNTASTHESEYKCIKSFEALVGKHEGKRALGSSKSRW
jgi:hypothetical protein